MASDDFFGFLKTKLRVTVFLYSMKQTITILILGFDFDLNWLIIILREGVKEKLFPAQAYLLTFASG